MSNGHGITQIEETWDVATRRSFAAVEVAGSRTLAPGSWLQTNLVDFRSRRMTTGLAPCRVDPGEGSYRQQRKRRKNRIVGVGVALTCFTLCEIASALIREAVGSELMGIVWGKSVGLVVGWLYISMAQAADLPAAQRGALCGWIMYLLSIPLLLQVS